tara:strand:- start:574 stop:1215 length:642 start_codon:yes stop_codon:yes gene_type:complete
MTDLYHRFVSAIRDLSQNPDKWQEEWRYAGGDYDHHLGYYKLKFGDVNTPAKSDRCICDHDIRRNNYLENKITQKLIVVGSCCIGKFIPKDKSGRTCAICREPHKNRKDNYCNDCRGGILQFGKYKGISYRSVLDRDPSYCAWALERTDGGFADFCENSRSTIMSKLNSEKVPFGKYRGMTYERVFRVDESYCRWIARKTDGTFASYCAYRLG